MISRRDLLRSFGIGTAAATAAPWSFAAMHPAILESPAKRDSVTTIHLDNNENAYGPSRRTAEAIRAASTTVNRYPAASDDLTEHIASFHGVKSERVLLGCGSTEILRMAAHAFLGLGKQMLQSSPTFEALELYSRSVGAEVISLPLTHEFAHDLESMLGRIASSTTLVYICNPNNPTGSITPRKGLEDFITNSPWCKSRFVNKNF